MESRRPPVSRMTDYLIYNDPLAYADLILNSKLNVLFE